MKIFCTFADSGLNKTLGRINSQAQKMNCYDKIIINNEFDLNISFRDYFKEKLKPNIKGYGYWAWKPQVILQVLSNINDGDLMQYTDAGCWLNPKGRERLLDYFSIVEREVSGILAFETKPRSNNEFEKKFKLPEYQWTKGDLLDYFKVRNNELITKRGQIGAGVIFIKKCKFSEDFIKQWLKVYYDDFSLADDSKSKSKNLDGFIEHRHDQSIFSLLCKINNIKTLSSLEYYYPSRENVWVSDWKELRNYPIWAKRDKDFGFFQNFLNLIKQIIVRLFSYLKLKRCIAFVIK